MFGAVYGDIIGSYYEVHHTNNYNFEFNRNSTFTDDSVLIAAVCKAILNNPSEVSKFGIFARSREYAAQYRHFYSCFKNAGLALCLQNGPKMISPAITTAMQTVPLCELYR